MREYQQLNCLILLLLLHCPESNLARQKFDKHSQQHFQTCGQFLHQNQVRQDTFFDFCYQNLCLFICFLIHQLSPFIRFTITFTITSFSSVRLSAIIRVRATRVLFSISLKPLDLYRIPFFSKNQRKRNAAILLLPSLNE